MTSYLISMYNEGVFCVLRQPTGRELRRVALSRREQCLLPQTLFIFLILLLVLHYYHTLCRTMSYVIRNTCVRKDKLLVFARQK